MADEGTIRVQMETGTVKHEPLKEAEEWVVLELLGHLKLAGRVTEEERFGTKLGRIDIPMEDGSFVTRYFSGAAVYGMTPVTETVARQVAKGLSHYPVQPWGYPKQITTNSYREDDDDDTDYREGDDEDYDPDADDKPEREIPF